MEFAKYVVPAEQLRWQCDPVAFDFECTKDLVPLGEFIGQERAIRAIEFGLSLNHDGYNIYVAGLTGTGKTSVVKTYIQKLIEERRAKEQVYPVRDWCYLYNFTDRDRPQIINLPPGKGKTFGEQIDKLMHRLKEELTKAFSSEEYQNQRKKMVEEHQSEQQKLFDEIREEAKGQGFLLEMTAVGPALIPMVDGKPMGEADYLALEESVRRELEEKRSELLKKLRDVLERAQDLDREATEKMQNTDKNVADFTVSQLFGRLVRQYKDQEKVARYLADLKAYTLDNLGMFKEVEEQIHPVLGVPVSYLSHGHDPFLPFQVNVFVDNSATEGPPVVSEINPNYANLFGKIERRFLFGGYLADHTMLKPGALHLANGGYLVLSAVDVLSSPGVWPALKRTIKTKEVRIEDPFEQFGLIAPQGLRPQAIPLDLKIILIGDSMLYQLLSAYDEDFWELFKVKADFDFEVKRTDDNMMAYASFIAKCCQEHRMLHFDRNAVARVVEYASRVVGDQEKLSTRFAWIKELIEESEYWARRENASLVSDKHVEKAVEERRFRHNLPDEQVREMITRGDIMIDVDGAVAGQVNGLSVYMLGDVTFGKPSRITCETFLGRGGVINIERESQLSGRIHDKGVLILGGYMGWKFAQDKPLSLSASLCFEQSYEGVDGDSASSTELYALLSSLSGVPIKQSVAVTGSVNQKGEIQPIGGVNQKIEGFFQVCRAKGLNGHQGVMIPRQNLKNLMLRQEVVDAVKEGNFQIYAVKTIDEGIEVLTGVEAGERKEDGTYPEGTISYLVDKKLREMATKLREFYAPEEEKGGKPSRQSKPRK